MQYCASMKSVSYLIIGRRESSRGLDENRYLELLKKQKWLSHSSLVVVSLLKLTKVLPDKSLIPFIFEVFM